MVLRLGYTPTDRCQFQNQFGIRDVGTPTLVITDRLANLRVYTRYLVCRHTCMHV